MAFLRQVLKTGWILAAVAGSMPAASLEYQVKAAFLYHFARFVSWPREASSGPLTICVFGEGPFGPALEEAVAGKHIDGRALAVRRLDQPGAAGACNILFAGGSDARRLSTLLEAARRGAVLTVGETREFQDSGGIIRFVLEQGKVRFEIDLDAARKAGLAVSSQLLRVARVVHGRPAGN